MGIKKKTVESVSDGEEGEINLIPFADVATGNYF